MALSGAKPDDSAAERYYRLDLRDQAIIGERFPEGSGKLTHLDSINLPPNLNLPLCSNQRMRERAQVGHFTL